MNANQITLALCLLSSVPTRAQTVPTATRGHLSFGTTSAEQQSLALGYRATKLIGAPLYNEGGQKLGVISDLAVNPDGSFSCVIVDVGRFLGMPKKLVAIPVQQLLKGKNKLVLSGADKDVLQKLPDFDAKLGLTAPT